MESLREIGRYVILGTIDHTGITQQRRVEGRIYELILLDIDSYKLSSVVVNMDDFPEELKNLLSFGALEGTMGCRADVLVQAGFKLLPFMKGDKHPIDIFKENNLKVHTLKSNKKINQGIVDTLVYETILRDIGIKPVEYSFIKINGIPTIWFKNYKVESHSINHIDFNREKSYARLIGVKNSVVNFCRYDITKNRNIDVCYTRAVESTDLNPYDKETPFRVDAIALTLVDTADYNTNNKYGDTSLHISSVSEKDIKRSNAIGGNPEYIFYHADVNKSLIDHIITDDGWERIRNASSEDEIGGMISDLLKVKYIDISPEGLIYGNIEEVKYTKEKTRVLVTDFDILRKNLSLSYDNLDDIIEELKCGFLSKLEEVIDTDNCDEISSNDDSRIIWDFVRSATINLEVNLNAMRDGERAGYAIVKMIKTHQVSDKVARMIVEGIVRKVIEHKLINGFNVVE